MSVKDLLKDAKSSDSRWSGNTFNCNPGNKIDTFCFDRISSTHQSMPELILKTEFDKMHTIACLCFNKGRAKNGNIIFGKYAETVERTLSNTKYTDIFKIVFENPKEGEVLWDELKEEITKNKLIVDITDIRSFKPVGVFTPIKATKSKPKSKPKSKAKPVIKKAT